MTLFELFNIFDFVKITTEIAAAYQPWLIIMFATESDQNAYLVSTRLKRKLSAWPQSTPKRFDNWEYAERVPLLETH